MIVVCDINTIWRERPIAALAEMEEVLSVVPADWLVARGLPAFRSPGQNGSMEVLPVMLPLSWASRAAWLGQRLLWRKIQRKTRELGKEIEAVIVTSPHYHALLDLVPVGVKTIYYASDDYRSYDGWCNMAALEKKMVRRVDQSFFVSDALAERACTDYGVDVGKISVSMNATEERFFSGQGEALPDAHPVCSMPRPIAGVIGGICDRLDFGLLAACADLPELGTLLLVGPLPENPSNELSLLLQHPRCISVGAQPHSTIHEWFKGLDVGLIPYAETELNRYCSPMRLFDHLATGVPLVATEACEQVKCFAERIGVCKDADSFVAALKERLSNAHTANPAPYLKGISWRDRAVQFSEAIREGI